MQKARILLLGNLGWEEIGAFLECSTPEKVLSVRCQTGRALPWMRPIILDEPEFMFSVGCVNIMCYVLTP